MYLYWVFVITHTRYRVTYQVVRVLGYILSTTVADCCTVHTVHNELLLEDSLLPDYHSCFLVMLHKNAYSDSSGRTGEPMPFSPKSLRSSKELQQASHSFRIFTTLVYILQEQFSKSYNKFRR